mmetsp:Transcript_17161/g.43041  ORF Transcript_17161/g.43041 Transcript_17161/m.43041 type:complete len:256 (-) Transcript_17161:556-1323(-)
MLGMVHHPCCSSVLKTPFSSSSIYLAARCNRPSNRGMNNSQWSTSTCSLAPSHVHARFGHAHGRPLAMPIPAVGSSQEASPQETGSQPSSLEEKVQRMVSTGMCSACRGSGRVPCTACNGTGKLSRGGYNKKTTLPKEIINSKWTAMEDTIGWRHFRVMSQRKAGAQAFLLMQASCDPAAQIWVNRDSLRDRARWAAGWLPMSEVGGRLPDGSTPSAQDTAAAVAAASKPCRSCSATGWQVCSSCGASGAALINV